jgi:hypothetical protein
MMLPTEIVTWREWDLEFPSNQFPTVIHGGPKSSLVSVVLRVSEVAAPPSALALEG